MSEAHEARLVWHALLSGGAAFVDEFTSDGRVYVIMRFRDPTGDASSLSERELEVVLRHAHGLSSKCVGISLGISAPTVSAHLARALGKLGLSTLGDLVRLHERLNRPAKDLRVMTLSAERAWIVSQAAPKAPCKLTATERAVAGFVAAGLTNGEIAALRRRSERTIANQVASLLHKLGLPSRHHVAGRMARAIPLGRNLRPGSAASTLDSIGAFHWSAGVTTTRTAT